jgi:hypothetical protein
MQTIPPTAVALGVALALAAAPGAAQQVADTTFRPEVGPPTWEPGEGPRVLIDGAHENFHTVDGRYRVFADLLRRDGLVVEGLEEPIGPGALEGVDLLVIANALGARQAREGWHLPSQSAFATSEMDALDRWIEEGGALLLLADHMPFPGAARELGARFGVAMADGFAVDTTDISGAYIFRASDGSLAAHPVTAGIDSVATFTGQAFRVLGDDAVPLLVFRTPAVQLEPDTAWSFHDATPSYPVDGWAQGAVIEHGAGRVVVLGEAAMLSAQLARRGDGTTLRMGMNAAPAAQNGRFALALVHWLLGR